MEEGVPITAVVEEEVDMVEAGGEEDDSTVQVNLWIPGLWDRGETTQTWMRQRKGRRSTWFDMTTYNCWPVLVLFCLSLSLFLIIFIGLLCARHHLM